MKVVAITEPGGPEVLEPTERPDPEPGPDDVVVAVRAAALNRADLLQRRGLYPAPPDAPADVPGLEYAGVVERVGRRVRDVEPGDRVMGLLGGGGYAERVAAPASLVLPIPDRLDFAEAAAVPEVFATAHDALFARGRLAAGETLLLHSVGGGVGTAALQLGRLAGAARIVGTASGEKLDRLEAAGLAPDVPVDRHGASFAGVVREVTGGRGADLVLDTVGADYWGANVDALAVKGRLVLVGLLGGARVEADLSRLLRKRITVVGTVLRSRPIHEKAALTAAVRERLLPLFADGRLRPVVDRTYPLSEAAEAHRAMERNLNLGKIVLLVG